jgi:alpha-beta hydrolase superfamily lysophospholipase
MTVPAGLPNSLALARLRTRDDVYLDGVFAEPRRRSEIALVWVHGLGSVFSSGQPLIRELSVRLTRAGVGYFKFNTRGHDVVAGRGRTLAGAAFERFRDCVLDLRAVIAFARGRGYRRIVLAGHSTGANKVLYYAAKTADRRVTGLILLGPISDIAGEAKRIGRRELGRRVARASRLAARDRRALVPSAWGFWSARRYLSLYRPGEAEDVFPYDRPGARWTALRAIRAPLAVMVGGRDEFLDRSPEALVEAFAAQAERAESFTGRIIPGALHGFQGREAAVARAVVDWIRDRGL